jgi:hypothetical protein
MPLVNLKLFTKLFPRYRTKNIRLETLTVGDLTKFESENLLFFL